MPINEELAARCAGEPRERTLRRIELLRQQARNCRAAADKLDAEACEWARKLEGTD